VLLRQAKARPLHELDRHQPSGPPHLPPAWTVWAVGCVIAVFMRPGEQTIAYHLGRAGFALARSLGTWSRRELVTTLTDHRLGRDQRDPAEVLDRDADGMARSSPPGRAGSHEELAVLDSLTGLANQTSFKAARSAALDDKSSRSTTVLFVDLDDFKDVFDVFGHGDGDDLLHEVAARLAGHPPAGPVHTPGRRPSSPRCCAAPAAQKARTSPSGSFKRSGPPRISAAGSGTTAQSRRCHGDQRDRPRRGRSTGLSLPTADNHEDVRRLAW
jgi:GGDEF domain-containing protein